MFNILVHYSCKRPPFDSNEEENTIDVKLPSPNDLLVSVVFVLNSLSPKMRLFLLLNDCHTLLFLRQSREFDTARLVRRKLISITLRSERATTTGTRTYKNIQLHVLANILRLFCYSALRASLHTAKNIGRALCLCGEKIESLTLGNRVLHKPSNLNV